MKIVLIGTNLRTTLPTNIVLLRFKKGRIYVDLILSSNLVS